MANTKNNIARLGIKPLLFCKGFFVMCLFLVAANGRAQFFDSIETSLTYKPTLDLKFESRNSFFANEWALISGFRVGLDYHKTFKVGLGYSWLRKEIKRQITVPSELLGQRTTTAEYFFHYGTGYAEYSFYNEAPFNLSIFASVGAGLSWNRYLDEFGQGQLTKKSLVLVYEPYMTGTIDVLRYFAVGGGMGFRLAMSGDKFSRNRLNTLIYVLKVKVKLYKVRKDFGI